MKKIIYFLIMITFIFSCNKKVPTDPNMNSGYGKGITIVLDWVPNTNHTGLYVAKELGYFEEEGIDNIEIVQPPEGSTTSLIGAGGAEFGISFQDTLAKTFASDNPIPVTAVATILQNNTSGLLFRINENTNIYEGQLVSMKYATWEDPIEQAILKSLMDNLGFDFNKIEMVPNTVTDVVSALQTDIDAVWVYYGWDGVAAELAGLKTGFIPIFYAGDELDYYTPVIIANNDFLDQHPEIAKKVMKAISRGYDYAYENREEAAKILLKYAPELSEELVLASQNVVSSYYKDVSLFKEMSWGEINQNRWDAFYDWLYRKGIIDKPIEKGYGFTNEFLPDAE